MEKRRIIEVVADVQIIPNPLLGKGFVDFAPIQIRAGEGDNVGRQLYLFDYRPAVVKAAKEFINSWASLEEQWEASHSLSLAFRQPARVVVMEKKHGRGSLSYLSLYPTDQKPTALLSESTYRVKPRRTEFTIKKDNSLWSWTSKARLGGLWEIVLVALTDETHRIIVHSYDYLNFESFTVISSDIRQMPKKKLLAELEPE